MHVVIFDIDGTLADITHRLHFVERRPRDWKSFFRAMDGDTPKEPIAELCRSLHAAGWYVVLCTGRPSMYRDMTETWLTRFVIPHHELYMRRDGDHRADDIIKEEMLDAILLDGYQPTLVIDDRQGVVDMWRRRGLMCLQCEYGDY